jgi:hypothetical protein
MSGMRVRTQDAAAALFLVMESVAWWIGIRAIATVMTREGYAAMGEHIERVRGAVPGTQAQIDRALAVTRDVATHGVGGAPYLVVLGTAVTAFLLVRWMVRQRMPTPFAAGLGVAASLLAFQVVVRLSVAGDLRIWEPLGVLQASFRGAPGAEAEIARFVANPTAGLAVPGALGVTMGGVALMWLRFLVAGRTPVTYERVLRSFGMGFVLLLAITAWIAIDGSVDVFPLVPVYFVVGIAALAVAQAARARPEASGLREPWVASLVVAVGSVALLAGLFGFVAFVDGGRLTQPLIDGVVWVAGRLAWAILYPFAVVMQAIVGLILGGRTLHLDQFNTDLLDAMQPPTTGEQRDSLIPWWLAFGLRALAAALAIWLLYRIGLIVFAARRRLTPGADAVEVRSRSSEHIASGLLRGLFRRRGDDGGIGGEWLRRHAAYQLFARVVQGAHDRGVERPVGATPIEFARSTGTRLDAPMFEPIGRAFDEVRYGRHAPDGGTLDALDVSLRAWERSHPRSAPPPASGEADEASAGRSDA